MGGALALHKDWFPVWKCMQGGWAVFHFLRHLHHWSCDPRGQIIVGRSKKRVTLIYPRLLQNFIYSFGYQICHLCSLPVIQVSPAWNRVPSLWILLHKRIAFIHDLGQFIQTHSDPFQFALASCTIFPFDHNTHSHTCAITVTVFKQEYILLHVTELS